MTSGEDPEMTIIGLIRATSAFAAFRTSLQIIVLAVRWYPWEGTDTPTCMWVAVVGLSRRNVS